MTPDHQALSLATRRRLTARVLGRGTVVVAGLVMLVACQNEPRQASNTPLSSIVAEGTRGHELFQAHCVACHGRDGRGDGIAATFLAFEPRDFWNEPFRYVSTLDGTATEEDLVQTIGAGRLNGQMPAAPWLSDGEIAALAVYVRELNRLGWVERLTAEFEGEGMSPVEIDEITAERVTPAETISVPMLGPRFRPDLETGRELYMQSCASCHGPEGRGDGLEMPLDELGRPIKVRDLVGEPIQGGMDPVELYKRIRCGVPGTPMPAQEALTDHQVWQLVYFARYLAGRPLDR